MKNVQSDIQMMMQAFDQETPDKPCLDTVSFCITDLRYKLIREEVVNELLANLNKVRAYKFNHKDIPPDVYEGVADGIIDSIVVIVGAAVAFGIDLVPLWDEVLRANMEKSTGPIREDGKRLKPEGWEPPRIKELLIEQGAKL